MTEVPFLTRCQGPLASVIMGLMINTPQARLTAAQVRGLLVQVVPGTHTGPQAVYPATSAYPQATRVVSPAGPSRRRGPVRMVLTVAVVVVLVLAAFFAGVAAGRKTGTAADPARGQTLSWGAGGDIPVFEVSYGYCVAAPLRKGHSVPSTSDCKQPHDFQSFGEHDVTSSSDETVGWPGAEALTRVGEAWCGLVFASDLITDRTKRDTLTYGTLIPSEKGWADKIHGGRQIVCVVQRRDGSQMSGSVVSGR
jgi:eukaryotic-like serine/threonine-protein kinase